MASMIVLHEYEGQGPPDIIDVVMKLVSALELGSPECISITQEGYAYLTKINKIIKRNHEYYI